MAAFPADDVSVNGWHRCRFVLGEYCAGRLQRLQDRAHFEGELTMTIKVGDKLPEAKFRVMTAEGPQVKTTDDIFKGKKVALFAVPGAYTGTCHKMHLPSIFLNAYAIKDKGVDSIAIVSVNDAFVMSAWKRDTDQRDEATFLADGNAISPRRSAWSWTLPATGLASAPNVTRCWSRTAWSRSSTSSPPPARSRSPAAIRCWRSCELRPSPQQHSSSPALCAIAHWSGRSSIPEALVQDREAAATGSPGQAGR